MSGFDWNGNGREDAGDWYLDYEIMNDKGDGGGGHGSGGRSGGSGGGCLLAVVLVVGLLCLLGSFS